MDFSLGPRETEWRDRVCAFMDQRVRPRARDYEAQQREGERWKVLPLVEELKAQASAEGLWNLFMPPSHGGAPVDDSFTFEGPGLTDLRYAFAPRRWAALAGRRKWSTAPRRTPGTWRCCRYGPRTEGAWLAPLIESGIRSRFPDDRAGRRFFGCREHPDAASRAMTRTMSSTAANGGRARRWRSALQDGRPDGEDRVPSAEIHQQQSMILVPLDASGNHDQAASAGIRLRRCAARAHGDRPRGRSGPGLEHALSAKGRGFEIARGGSDRAGSTSPCDDRRCRGSAQCDGGAAGRPTSRSASHSWNSE